MRSEDLIEKVENWGWRITRDGIYCLDINYVNTKLTDGKQLVNTKLTDGYQSFPLENHKAENEDNIPGCFHMKTCHIKQFCKDKKYTSKTSMVCDSCVWFKSETWIGNSSSKGN